jgi:hypothetical protein
MAAQDFTQKKGAEEREKKNAPLRALVESQLGIKKGLANVVIKQEATHRIFASDWILTRHHVDLRFGFVELKGAREKSVTERAEFIQANGSVLGLSLWYTHLGYPLTVLAINEEDTPRNSLVVYDMESDPRDKVTLAMFDGYSDKTSVRASKSCVLFRLNEGVVYAYQKRFIKEISSAETFIFNKMLVQKKEYTEPFYIWSCHSVSIQPARMIEDMCLSQDSDLAFVTTRSSARDFELACYELPEFTFLWSVPVSEFVAFEGGKVVLYPITDVRCLACDYGYLLLAVYRKSGRHRIGDQVIQFEEKLVKCVSIKLKSMHSPPSRVDVAVSTTFVPPYKDWFEMLITENSTVGADGSFIIISAKDRPMLVRGSNPSPIQLHVKPYPGLPLSIEQRLLEKYDESYFSILPDGVIYECAYGSNMRKMFRLGHVIVRDNSEHVEWTSAEETRSSLALGPVPYSKVFDRKVHKPLKTELKPFDVPIDPNANLNFKIPARVFNLNTLPYDSKKMVCENCGQKEGLATCMGCKQAFYCSMRCAAAHWPKHFEFCLSKIGE